MIDAKDVISSSILVEEPLKKINDEINTIKGRVVVLSGGRGVGKTTFLLNRNIINRLDKDGISSIYAKFNFENVTDYLEDDLKEHYYELKMTSILLDYIMDTSKLSVIDSLIMYAKNNFMRKLINHVNNDSEINMNDDKLLHYGDFTYELIDEIKRSEGTNKIELLADRFDWMENSSSEAEKNIAYYFQMFDKVIITTDDLEYNGNHHIINLDYSKDMQIVSEILTRYVAESNIQNKTGLYDFLTVQRAQQLINMSNGNLRYLLEAIDYISKYVIINDFNIRTIYKELEKYVSDQMEQDAKIKKILNHPHKLYI